VVCHGKGGKYTEVQEGDAEERLGPKRESGGRLEKTAPPNIVSVMKSVRMSWAGHVARMGAVISVYRHLFRKHVRK